VDPTGFIAPERIELGLAHAVPHGDPVPWMARHGEGPLDALRWRWDALNNQWNHWVLAYGPTLQQQWLAHVGLGSWPRLGVAMTIILTLTTATIAVIVLHRSIRPSQDPVKTLYDRFCHKLKLKGLPRHPHEGPQDYANRVTIERPELAAQIQLITRVYLLLRYEKKHPRTWQARLKRLINNFQP
jgi:hypothetical protein